MYLHLGTGAVVRTDSIIGVIEVKNAYYAVRSDDGARSEMQIHQPILPFFTCSTLPPVRREMPSSSQQVMSVCPPPMRLRTNS